MAIRLVTPETVQLPLSDGAHITVKKRLNHGEREDMFARMLPSLTPGAALQIESKGVRSAKVLAYLVGWSAADIPYSQAMSDDERVDTLKGLDTASFDEIERAIDDHIAAGEKEIAARKNAQAGAPSSDQISTSVGP